MTINELTVFHDVPWSSTIRINFQISLPYKFYHSTCLVIWFRGSYWWCTPSQRKNLPFDFGISLKDQGLNPKNLEISTFQKKLGDFEGWFWSLEELRTPIPLTMKDLIVGTKTNKKLKLFGFMTCLMLFISDGLWTWFLRLMVWSKLEELTVLISTLYYLHTNILFNLCWICIFLSFIYIYTL